MDIWKEKLPEKPIKQQKSPFPDWVCTGLEKADYVHLRPYRCHINLSQSHLPVLHVVFFS